MGQIPTNVNFGLFISKRFRKKYNQIKLGLGSRTVPRSWF